MSWVRLDDQFPDHPKVAGLSNDAFCLHVTAMCWTAKQQTDGKLPSRLLTRLAWRCQDPASAATELIEAGVWDKTSDGWEIHDFLVYNPTKEQVAELAVKRSAAGVAGAMARWQTDGKPDGKSHGKPYGNMDGKADGKIMPPSPSPSPVLVPDNSNSDIPTEAQPTQNVNGEHAPTNGHSSSSVDIPLFLSVIGFNDPEPFVKNVNETLLAKWAFYYQCLTPAQRKAVQSWPALVNDRVRNNKPPRLTGEQAAQFYREWSN